MQETQMKLDRLVVIKIDGSLWSGRKKLRKEDLILADGSVLPPEGLASLGSKRIADPKELLIFTRLKKEAERICLQVGSRFLGGIALPETELPRVRVELGRISKAFEEARRDYLDRYDETIETWINQHPDFSEAIRRAVEPAESVGRLLKFDYVIFRVQGPNGDSGAPLEQRVDSLSTQLFSEIALMARQFAQGSLIGKDRASRKILNPLRRIRHKLDGLAFLDVRVNPVIETITDLIERAPRSGEITGTYLREVLATTLLLSDPDSIRKHGEGLLNPMDGTRITPSDEGLFNPTEMEAVIDGVEDDEEDMDAEESDIDDLLDPIPRRDVDPLLTRDFWF